MPGAIFVNGRDMSDVGLEPLGISGWFDMPTVSRRSEQMTNTTGAALGTGIRIEPRKLSLQFYLKPQLLTDRQSLMDIVNDTFTGLCEVQFVDKPNRVIRAYVESVATRAENESVGLIEPALVLTITMVAYDAAIYDTEPTVLAVTTTPRQVPLGSWPSGGVLHLMGSMSGNVTITYRAHTGDVLQTLVLNGTLAADEYLEVDFSDRTITKISNAGVRDETAYSFKSSGNWFVFDPADGNRTVGVWPTIELSTGTGVLIYRKAWAS